MQIGDNPISIIVQAENGNVRTYEINVKRKQNGNAKLIRVDNDKGAISNIINSNTVRIDVRNEIDEITITGIPEVITSRVISGNGKYELDIGENIIKMEVRAEDRNCNGI